MPTVSVILPCLNEEEGIGHAIKKILSVFVNHSINGEIIVVDNGSTDRSALIARRFPIKYVFEPKRGYGRAYLAGFARATGRFVVMVDPDGSYDVDDIPKFLSLLENSDVVLGSRFMGHIEKGAMPFLHRYFGNPFLRFLLHILFNFRVSEPTTGFLAIRRDKLNLLGLKEPGMEFFSEVLIRIRQKNLHLIELPIGYYPRKGIPKLRPWRDGFRSVCFMVQEKLRA